MSALGQKQTFKLLFDVIDWVPGREPKLRLDAIRSAMLRRALDSEVVAPTGSLVTM